MVLEEFESSQLESTYARAHSQIPKSVLARKRTEVQKMTFREWVCVTETGDEVQVMIGLRCPESVRQ